MYLRLIFTKRGVGWRIDVFYGYYIDRDGMCIDQL